ncbi:MAG: UDP-N-acetylmuramoyl-L-alanine--D-glutamate ligase [Deltaproteobacteria bacterium]|nr:UDP-N-acetylmuramoyl-L-alanine--D-glutamate ligase [Deltaproteobacteria bacterium]
MDLQGKKALVVGLARTGLAVVRFLAAQGARVKISEAKGAKELGPILGELGGLDVEWELGGHTVPFFMDAELIVVSPGVPLEIEPLVQARRRGIPLLSELELSFRLLRRPLIAITGTNGKTTTTTLVGEMLRASGKTAFVGGNIGRPLLHFAAAGQIEEWAVAEVSSFQLEAVADFRPAVGVLLNITEDHLDRHGDFSSYIRAKGRLFENQQPEDFAVLNADDPLVFPFPRELRSKVVLFSARRPVPVGSFLQDGAIIFRGADGQRELFPLDRLRIRGAHNLENLMAALAVAKILGCPREALQEVMEGFRGLEHRLEWAGDFRGVGYYNDSKGTNVGAVVKSLLSFTAPIWLIAGGKDKGGSYDPLRQPVAERVKGLALLGEARERMCAALGELTETVKVDSLEEAVRWASARAKPGEIVLLSPACSSFDMFKNYEERGERFKELVGELEKTGPLYV